MTTYKEKLLDPRWQKKRLEIFNRDKFTCQECLDTESTLHVHHKIYLPNKEPWEYDNYLLKTLCSDCHQRYFNYGDFIIGELVKASKIYLTWRTQGMLADEMLLFQENGINPERFLQVIIYLRENLDEFEKIFNKRLPELQHADYDPRYYEDMVVEGGKLKG